MELLEKKTIARFRVAVGIEIRRCEEKDLSLLEWEGMFTEHREIFQETFRRQQVGETVMLVADAGNFPVGQIWLDLTKRSEHRAGYIWALRLLPGWRGLGIGKRLMRAAESLLDNEGFCLAELGVETWNVDALRFYRRLGYKILDLIQEETEYQTPEGSHRVHKTEQWLMRKALAGCEQPVVRTGSDSHGTTNDTEREN